MSTFKGVKARVVDKTKGSLQIEKIKNSIIFKYPCNDSSDCTPYDIVLSPGVYRFELWGAQGGNGRFQNEKTIREGSGGKGAYAAGTINLIGTTRLFLYIGGKGEDQIYYDKTAAKGGFNGGGKGGVDMNVEDIPESSGGGGGATDVRLIKGNTLQALKSRLIVAAAGGGSVSSDNSYLGSYLYIAGDGGTHEATSLFDQSLPGTQISGNFGFGQDGLSFELSEKFPSGGSTGGSGGGYYGGTTLDGMCEMSGAGGSSFVSGHESCIAVKNDTSSPPNRLNSPIHYSGQYFTDPIMKSKGDDDFLDPYGNNENGHFGNGVAKVTMIDLGQSIPLFFTCKKTRRNSVSTYLIVIILSSHRFK